LIEPEFESKEIQEGALKGFVTAVSDDMYAREKAATDVGTVVSIGPNAWRPEGLGGGIPWCDVGDKVRYAKHAGKIVNDGEKEYFIINDEDIQCVIRDVEYDFIED
jgi:co-chaperonin GroES (HSP10)